MKLHCNIISDILAIWIWISLKQNKIKKIKFKQQQQKEMKKSTQRIKEW